jgi:hypothetical protein
MPVGKVTGKRITIKAFATPPKLPPNFYESTSKQVFQATWSLLEEKGYFSRQQQSQQQESPPALQHCYTSVVNLVSHQFGPKLYHDVVVQFQDACRSILSMSSRCPNSDRNNCFSNNYNHHSEETDLLTFLSEQYHKYVTYLLLVRHIFLTLDRSYAWEYSSNTAEPSSSSSSSNDQALQSCAGHAVKRTSHTTTLLEVGLQQFYLRLCELHWDDDIYNAWWKLLWQAFLTKSTTQLRLLESTINIWKDLGVARSILQKTQPLLQSSLETMSIQYQQHSTSNSYSGEAFMSHVYQQWNYVSIHWTFLPKHWLRSQIEQHLMEPHLNDHFLLKSLDIKNLEHCQHLWNLAARIDGGLPRVLDAICLLVKRRGIQCIQQHSVPTKSPPSSNLTNISASPQTSSTLAPSSHSTAKWVIGELLDLHGELCKFRETVGDIPLKTVWSDILNESPLVAEWLAKYVDLEFRNLKDDSASFLEPVLYLFAHMQAKDIFEAFYKKDLAKRLLMNRVQNMDLERQFVSLLKAECGTGYTSKMEGMFHDIEWSRESLSRYRESPEFSAMRSSRPDLSQAEKSDKNRTTIPLVDMEVQILTIGYWPVYPQYPKLLLPESLTLPQENFWNYFKKTYQGRKITWQYALGNCTVVFQMAGTSKSYDLIVTLLQALILLCFNERDHWTTKELRQQVGLDDVDEMEVALQSLAMGKEHHRILNRRRVLGKRDTQRCVMDDDVFLVNTKFTSNLKRVKIPNMQKKETREEREKVVDSVQKDRLYFIDAVLVRIMKARKTLLHSQLIAQVLEQVKFPAQVSDIKQRIESLIDRDYLARDDKDRTRYNYLA